MVGDLAVPLEEIAPGAVGRAELRGTVWSARNRAPRTLLRGERCRVVTVGAADDFHRARRSPLMDGVGLMIVGMVLALLALVVIAKTAIVVPQQSAYVVERLGRLQRHAERRVPHPDAVRRHHPLPALAQGDCGRHPGPGLHHARQRAGRASTACCISRCSTPSAPPTASPTTCSRSPSSPRRRCAARSARSTWTRPSRSARTSTRRSSASWTRRASRGASRCCATRSRTSRRRTTSSRRWRSRCAPSARSAPSS